MLKYLGGYHMKIKKLMVLSLICFSFGSILSAEEFNNMQTITKRISMIYTAAKNCKCGHNGDNFEHCATIDDLKPYFLSTITKDNTPNILVDTENNYKTLIVKVDLRNLPESTIKQIVNYAKLHATKVNVDNKYITVKYITNGNSNIDHPFVTYIMGILLIFSVPFILKAYE
jgi:hypothetical protein